jgi:hypothetical protein
VNFDAQVVTFAGATVARGVGVGGSTSPFTVSQMTPAASSTFLLYSSRMTGDVGGDNNICRRRLEGRITNSSTLTFTRGCNGADIQDIAWEHVRLPAGALVQQVTQATASGQPTATATWSTAVDLTRTVGFIGGLGPGGTASGSTGYATDDRVGAALARVVLTGTTGLTFTRTSNSDVGTFTAYVVQFAP